MRIRKALIFAPALVLLAFSTAFADGVLTVTPGSVGAGQLFTVSINIAGPTVKGVPSGISNLYAVQFDISFSPGVIQARGVTEGSFLDGGGPTFFSSGTTDNSSGTIAHISDTLVTVPSGVSGNGVLVEVKFQGVAAGTSQITLSNIKLLDSNLNPIVVDDTPDQLSATVTIASM